MMYPSNIPFVAIRKNNVVTNFPDREYKTLYPNRSYRRKSIRTQNAHLIPQKVFKWDSIHHKLVLLKTIYHLV